MQKTSSFLTGPSTKRTVLFLSIFTFFYFLLITFVIRDIYKVPFVGAVYELLWLPMLLLLVLLPVASFIQVLIVPKPEKLLAFFSLLLSLATILLLIVKYA